MTRLSLQASPWRVAALGSLFCAVGACNASSPGTLAGEVPACPGCEDGGAAGDAGALSSRDFAVSFAARVGAKDAKCGSTYSLGTPKSDVELLDLRFYVSGVVLITAAGEEEALTLTPNEFQSSGVTLIDLEDGSGACSGTGNTPMNTQVVGSAPDADYVALRFELGVPYDLNHQAVSTAESPLNIQNLYWNWLPGYKFVRIDVKPTTAADAGVPAPWNFHLGSTLCSQNVADGGVPNPAAPPDMECGRPNLPTIELDEFEPDSSTVVVDLGALFLGSDVTTNLAGPTPGCMSFPTDEADCVDIFSRVGLDYQAGQCESDCREQSAFYLD